MHPHLATRSFKTCKSSNLRQLDTISEGDKENKNFFKKKFADSKKEINFAAAIDPNG